MVSAGGAAEEASRPLTVASSRTASRYWSEPVIVMSIVFTPWFSRPLAPLMLNDCRLPQ